MSTRWTAPLRYVKAKRRSKHDVYLSWDEWQVWYKGDPVQGNWTEAPHLAEEIYNLEDALVVGAVAQRLPAQEPTCSRSPASRRSSTSSPGCTPKSDGLLKHPSYYPFKLVSNHARGNALDVLVKAPQVETKQFGGVPALDVSASYDEATGNGAIFIVNRSQTDAVVTDLVWQDGSPDCVAEAWQLAGTDVKEVNTWEEPNRLRAKPIAAACRRRRQGHAAAAAALVYGLDDPPAARLAATRSPDRSLRDFMTALRFGCRCPKPRQLHRPACRTVTGAPAAYNQEDDTYEQSDTHLA